MFDPLAVALIIAFNGLVTPKNRKEEENLTENIKLDEQIRQDSELEEKTYQVYGETPILTSEKNAEVFFNEIENPTPPNDNLIDVKNQYDEVLVENTRIPIDLDGDGTIDGYDTDSDGIIDEWSINGHAERASGNRNLLPYYAKPDFDWSDKAKWINDRNAINYWIKYKRGQNDDLVKIY